METGDVLEMDASGAEIVDRVAESYVFVDGLGVGDIGKHLVEDRRLLSRNGFLVVVVTLDKYTGGLVGEPDIITRGFVYEVEADDLLEGIKREVAEAVRRGGTRSEITKRLESSLSRFAHPE